MRVAYEIKQSPGLLLQKLFSGFSAGWIVLFFDLYQGLRRWFSAQQPKGLYEILDYDTTLELLDAKGHTAKFSKRQKVRFLQNNIIAFEDYAWGAGTIFHTYSVAPGKAVDFYPEGDRWNVLISLRESKQSGDIQDFRIERTIMDGFTNAEEWKQVEIRHRTHRVKMGVIFPKDRPCRQAQILQRSRKHAIVLGPEHFHRLPNGRQLVSWETQNVQPLEIFTLRWQW
jgi:hypothetical protein